MGEAFDGLLGDVAQRARALDPDGRHAFVVLARLVAADQTQEHHRSTWQLLASVAALVEEGGREEAERLTTLDREVGPAVEAWWAPGTPDPPGVEPDVETVVHWDDDGPDDDAPDAPDDG